MVLKPFSKGSMYQRLYWSLIQGDSNYIQPSPPLHCYCPYIARKAWQAGQLGSSISPHFYHRANCLLEVFLATISCFSLHASEWSSFGWYVDCFWIKIRCWHKWTIPFLTNFKNHTPFADILNLFDWRQFKQKRYERIVHVIALSA